jgi:Ser-tRNA(Ala) deacylase AlaX
MQTKLLYLKNMYLYTSDAIIQNIIPGVDNELALILDQTIFYPQGGGQPSDKGIIKTDDALFEVQFVSKQDNLVYHKGILRSGELTCRQRVELALDTATRNMHNVLHTAGHLIDYALGDLGFHLVSAKGYHFPNGPYVEYEGKANDADIEKLKVTLGEHVQEIINRNLPVTVAFLSEDFYSRAMQAEGYAPILCGGTHVKNTMELGEIIIRKIKNEKGNLRISYALREAQKQF